MKKYLVFILLIIVFRLLLDWIYRNEISPLFEYNNYVDESTKGSLILSWCVLAIFLPFVLWIINERDTFLHLIVLFLLYFRIIPFSSLMMFRPQSWEYVLANVVYWSLILVLLKYIKPQNLFGVLRNQMNSRGVIFIITIISVTTVLIVSGVYCNFRIHLSLDDVYELRMESREFNMPLILAYLHAATSNIIPILMVFYITQHKKLLVYLLAFIGLLNFSIAGHKSTLFKILLCLGLYYSPKFDFKKYMPILFILLCIFAVVEFLWIDTAVLSTIFIRRGFYTPAGLDISYFNYIIKNGPTYFTKGIAFELGALSGDEAKRCNNGMFSDAFMNLGYIGCLIFPFVFAYFIKIVEYISRNQNESIKVFTAFLIVSTLASSYFTTSLLTHGLFMLCVTLYFIPKQRYLSRSRL